MSRYRKVENLKDILELPNRYITRDFYMDISENGRRKDLIRSFKRGDYIPFVNLEYLERRVHDGKIYTIGKSEKFSDILSQEEIDALLSNEEPKSVIGPYPNIFRKKFKFSKNDPTIRVLRQFMKDMEDPENSRAFVDGRLDDIKYTSRKGENKK